MEAQQPRYRVYEDSGKIVKLNLTTKESRSIWPKELEQHIERGTVPDFWSDEEVLALLKKTLPRAQISEVFAARISETKAQIATLEADLAKIPTRKAALLAQDEIDQTALDTLEAEEERCAKTITNLKVRVTLLAERQESAEGEEAKQRLHAIVAEAEKLVELEGPALAAFGAAVKVLAGRAQVIADLHKKHSELGSERVYLIERYRLSPVSMPQLQEMPNGVKVSNELAGIFSSARQQDSPWVRKRSEWHDQRSRPQAVAAE
jgi:hypothetical protein